jgi:hypothetical protein
MTRLVIFLVSLMAVSSSAFVPATKTQVSPFTLQMAASSIGPKKPTDGWTGKPGYVAKSTTPVANKKVSKLQRLMMDDVMIEPNYFLSVAVALLCPLIIWYHPCKFRKRRKSLAFRRKVSSFQAFPFFIFSLL